MIRKFIIVVAIGLCFRAFGAELSISPIFEAEMGDTPGSTSFEPDIDAVAGNMSQRVLLATSIPDYPVTPGDVFRITYIRLSEIITTDAIVMNDFTMNLNIFGTLSADKLTYPQLRNKVEKMIVSAYPDSKPQLVLQSTGIFRIYIKGEVRSSTYVQCWGLTRLSDIVRSRITQYASTRNVSVISKDGKTKKYDLFLATRTGDIAEDPVIKPEDTVVVGKSSRKVGISGFVRRPGTYELFDGENLIDLVERYADGSTDSADMTRIRITRQVPSKDSIGETFYIDALGSDYKTFGLKNTDSVYVPGIQDKLPIVFFEGALNLSAPDNDPLMLITGRLGYRFIPGELLSSAIRKAKKSFSQLALLEGAYIIRESVKQTIPVNIEALLSGSPATPDIPLVHGDRIVIPMRQFFVTVSGAVLNPGRYPYVPDRTISYYIDCAGGFDPQKNSGGAVMVVDSHNAAQPSDRPIQPEDVITAEYNNPGYYINQWLPVIELTVSVTALVIAIVQLVK